MASLFRRNTTTSAPKKDEEFSDYATVISHESDPRKLKEYIGRLYKAFKDKSRSLRSAYSKLDNLNAEILQEKTRLNDIEDENKSLRDQMKELANQVVSKEEQFSEWQAKIVEHTEQERELFEEENEVQSARYETRIAELEDALQVANDELARLTARVRELIDAASEDSRSSFSYDSRVSEQTKTLADGEKHELTQQIIEITERRMSLQTEVSLLEEENHELRAQYREIQRENVTLRRENEELKQQIGKRAFMKSLESVNLDDD
ncbi:263_t:CDS:2 [Paraglomus occultum]|uniref:263_t:CDS:1 n=1 Tax=Paraglomus occultum TaxID=144539 RepID=A0A9N9F4C5_9GLOM|nr:263_t:CDS:2 [Paraglomus occultum]